MYNERLAKVYAMSKEDFEKAIRSGEKICSVDMRLRDFRELNFDGAELHDAIVNGSDFTHANMTHTGLIQTMALHCIFCHTVLKQCNAFHADFTSSKFLGANLTEGTYIHTNFTGCDFTSADLSRGIFRNANFDNAILLNTKLQGADLTCTNLINAKLKGAWWTDTIQLERQPIIINGLALPGHPILTIYILDGHMQIGKCLLPLSRWQTISDAELTPLTSELIREYWSTYKKVLLDMARTDDRDFTITV